MTNEPVLNLESLSIRFGGLTAVDKLNMKLQKGELVGLIGPNGAGKTTVFNLITGIYIPTEGNIHLDGENINNFRPSIITQKGIARTFQNIRLFKDLTVLENILIAQHFRMEYNIFEALLRLPRFWREEKRAKEEARELLKIFNLNEYENYLAKNLPYGKQRRLEMCRALATKPKLLLLDEPAAGMNPKETADLTDLIKWVREHFSITILLIEHDMKLVMGVCERIYVLDYGQLIAQGNPKEIKENTKVIEAYLGPEDI